MPCATTTIRGTVCEAFRDSAARHARRDFLCILPETAAKYAIEARSYSYEQAAAEIETLRRRYT